MNIRISYVAHTVFILWGMTFLSELSCQNNPVDTNEDWEFLNETVPVRGEIKVGIMEEFNEEKINVSSFFVLVPEKEDKYLCVDISSRNGVYKASRKYELVEVQPGPNEFVWPTTYESELSNFRKQDIIILCSVGETCDEDPDYYTLASWNESFRSETVSVLLLSEKAPVINIVNEGTGESVDIDCQKLELNPMIAYDCKCDIPKKSIAENTTIYIVKRVRKLDKITFKAYDFPIKIPIWKG